MTCKDCQELCNRSFETKFLKGTNFVALVRATLGIRGRGREPVYGFDGHGSPLALTVQSGFPPIRIGLGPNGAERFAQVILLDSNHAPLTYTFLPARLSRPVRADFFASMVPEIPALSKAAALWLDGDICPVNVWQEAVDAFVSWAETNRLSAQVSSVVPNQSVPLTIEWNGAEVVRGIAKIALMYALYKIPLGERYLPDLGALRDFVRLGVVATEDATRPFGPVKQWSGPHPAEEALRGVEFTYLIALVRADGFVYCFVQLHNMGLYAVRVGSSPLIPSKLSTFVLRRHDNGDRFELIESEHSAAAIEKLASAASITPTALP